MTILRTEDSGWLLMRRSGCNKLIKAATVDSWWFFKQPETTKVAIVER